MYKPNATMIRPAYDLTLAQYALAMQIYPIPHRRTEELIILDELFNPTGAYANEAERLIFELRAIQCANVSYLHYANFSIYNEVYHLRRDTDSCDECSGAAGTLTSEYQGDPPMGAVVTSLEYCSCLCAGLCPGCMQPLAYTFDLSALGEDTPIVKRGVGFFYPTNTGIRVIDAIDMPNGQMRGEFEYNAYQFGESNLIDVVTASWFSCACCGWAYDPDRHSDNYDDGDYYDDYPAFDADQLFN